MNIDVLYTEQPKLINLHPLCLVASAFEVISLDTNNIGIQVGMKCYSDDPHISLGYLLDKDFSLIGEVHPDDVNRIMASKSSRLFLWVNKLLNCGEPNKINRTAKTIERALLLLPDPDTVRYVFILKCYPNLNLLSSDSVFVKLIKFPKDKTASELLLMSANERKEAEKVAKQEVITAIYS